MASKKELILINNYWLKEFDYLEEDYPTCFVCGKETNLQLCHLIPDKLGGPKQPDNIVLLCTRCHSKAPNIAIPQIMINWIHEETVKYNLITHMKWDDMFIKVEYLYSMFTRLQQTFSNIKNITDIFPFVESKLHKDVLCVPQFFEANNSTFTLYYKYLSEYDKLEEDYLHFLKEYKEGVE